MKKICAFSIVLFFITISQVSYAQDADRYKLQLDIQHQGKTITTFISNVNYGFSRLYDDGTIGTTKDTSTAPSAKATASYNTSIYLAVSLKKINKDLLQLMGSSKARYNGAITITDTYGKEAARKIEFKDAQINSLSEGFSTTANDYGSSSLNIAAKKVSIDGVEMEP